MPPGLFDKVLLPILGILLVGHYLHFTPPGVDIALLSTFSFIGLLPVLISAIRALWKRVISVDLLASVALIASLLTREWASAVFINLMLTSARIFAAYTEGRARRAIESLFKLRPEKVKVRRNGEIVAIDAAEVVVGDIVVVEAGDRIPVDGVVKEGQAAVDQSSLTGESLPVNKKSGESVYSSTLCESGSLLVQAEKVGKDTTLEKIIVLVESSQEQKPGIRTTADKFAAWYIGIILVASVAVFLIFRNLSLLLSLLLVVCADDLAVAVPMAFLAAVGYAARRGVIVKGGSYLEAITDITTVITDKTGTITKGTLKVQSLQPAAGVEGDHLLSAAASLESFSNHPMAKAVVSYAAALGINHEKIDEIEEVPGKGMKGLLRGQLVVCGNLQFLGECNIAVPGIEMSRVVAQEEAGYSVVLVARGGAYLGSISIADELRPEAAAAIQRLKLLGVKNVVMLTGDNEKVAARIAREVGITTYHAGLLPEQKLAYVKSYISKGEKVAMLGDGINDAASLAAANVGVAMGVIGSDTAIEAADIALMRDDLNEIAETIELGRYTRKIARQDFIIWAISNAIGIGLVVAGIIGPQGAAMYNFLTDFFPLFNSIRLFNLHLRLPHVKKHVLRQQVSARAA